MSTVAHSTTNTGSADGRAYYYIVRSGGIVTGAPLSVKILNTIFVQKVLLLSLASASASTCVLSLCL